MAYQPNIPAATDQISQSQADIQANFQALAPLVQGVIDFPDQSASPPVFPAGDVGLYAQTPTALQHIQSGVNELILVNQAGGMFPISALTIAPGDFCCYLPSGVLLKWGNNVTGTTLGVYNQNILTTPTSPAFNNIWATFLMVTSAGVNADLDQNLQHISTTTLAGPARTTISMWVSKRTSNAATGATPRFFYLIIGN